MARKKKTETKRPIESYEHRDKQRVNNPPVGLVTPDTDPDAGAKKTCAYDPHLDSQLQWAGKAERSGPKSGVHFSDQLPSRETMPGNPPNETMIRVATPSDAAPVASLYNHYVTHTIITFEEETVSADEMARRIEAVQSAALPWLVAEHTGKLVGYAYATPWRPRSAYRFSVEITVYLDPGHAGRGIGSALYAELLPMLQERGINAVLGGIALPNEASIALHEKFGMRKVAHLEQVGFKFERWIDVGYWQRTLQTG